MYSLCLAIIALASAPPAPSPSPKRVFEANGFDSELGSVCVTKEYASWRKRTLKAPATSCKVSVVESANCSPDKLALAWSDCDLDGGTLKVKHPGGVSVTVKLAKVPTCTEPLHWKGDSLVHANGAPFTGKLEFRDAQGQRVSRDIKGGKVEQQGDRAALSASQKRVIHSESTQTCEWAGSLEPPADGGLRGGDGDSVLGEPPPLGQLLANPGTWCQLNAERLVERWRRKRETLCAWTDGKGKFVEVYRPQHLLPGKRLNFVLLGPKNYPLLARQEGTIGYTAELDDQTATEGAARVAEAQPDAKSGQSQRWVFEGRGPGLAPVILEKEPGKEVHRIEIDYPKTYMGSVRVGFGLVWGNAVGPRYEAMQQPGSPTHEIVEKEGSKVASELVLAYSVYPEAMLGGRNYRERLFSRNNWGFGPVVGVGVVSAANGKVDVFRSIYFGLEFEPVRFFSIGVGPVLRRVDALADGFHVGSALADANVPTKERLAFGWFLMINVSPRFMKTAFPGK